MGTIQPRATSARIRDAATAFQRSLNHLLWPAVCLVCRESIGEEDEGLCRQCWDELLGCMAGDYCPRCGRDASTYGIVEGMCPDCQGREFHFDGIARAGIYRGALQRMILSFKRGATEFDRILGTVVAAALEGSHFAARIDVIVPVPLHWSRRFVRGYNQAHILAKKLKYPAAKISADLVRIRRTKAQPAAASVQARAKNVAGAFGIRRDHRFADKTICLVDDIKTSGATLSECAKTLKAAGAANVYALVVAVAGQKN